MASEVQICNMAVSHIGLEARIAAINPPDGSVEAGHCATFYGIARTELLETGNWNFSLARAALAQTTNLSETWEFAYVKPSNILRALRILRPSHFSYEGYLPNGYLADRSDDRDGAPFDIEGDVVYSNQPDAVLVYVRDVTDTNKFTPSFKSALSLLLSSYIAGPIIKGTEGARLGDAMRQRAMSVADMAATAAANASDAESANSRTTQAVRA